MAIETDVLIVGSGSAGLCAAVWLARRGIDFHIIEKRDGPLRIGQADGVQCRTVEVFESFGMRDEMVKHAYWVNEVCFWSVECHPETGEEFPDRIWRTDRTADVAPGLSWQPHVILNQARLNELLIGDIEKHSSRQIEYDAAATAVEVNSEEAGDHSARAVTVKASKNGEEQVYRAKYVLACDGAHSTIRKSLGYKMIGDSTDVVWGVMDIFPVTDFPDIRKKVSIRSDAGNLLIIPREGDAMVRFYLQLPDGTAAKSVRLEDLHETARKILSQYTLEIKSTFWWSAYSIGQRLADHFSKDDRVFLTGDACHTHSPKAGQGMNLSLQDGYNIGWKLAAILKGEAPPSLLKTYNLEREKTASDLIDFDRELSKLFSTKAKEHRDVVAKQFSDYFIRSGKYTAGLTTTYEDSSITNAKVSSQELAKNVTVGMRFPSAQVVRFSDARAKQLARHLQADGRWRIIVFGGDVDNADCQERLEKFSDFLTSKSSPIVKFTPRGADPDEFIEPVLVLCGSRRNLDDNVVNERWSIPEVFYPVKKPFQMRDPHKVYVDDESYNYGHGHAYETLGVDPNVGAVVVVRPDQYVSMVTSLDDHDGVAHFFEGYVGSQASTNS
ncbi:phenol 2-monooxygenase [Trichodelitschia bisporula]|uniref:Phenol 2-monooxygenase n=1 Tax=Trichodelitschia bisporula TaxID=703511 RepID=A0A6G1HSS4_9PEZI|nr:phenol 2-monooxygenase [Trichodelitschia bisporula]